MPKVLVVLPTLGDRLDYLRETLDSVALQRGDVELTIVLVSPERATAAQALGREYGAVLVQDPGTGISAAINAGIAARTDEDIYAWIGDDDAFRPGGLRRLVDLLEREPDAVVAYGGCDYISPEGDIISTSNAGALALVLLPWGPDLIPHPGAAIRLDDLEAIGCFDEQLKYAMDLDVFLKLRRRGRFVSTRVPVSAFRWHPDSLTVANRAASSAESEAVKQRHLGPLAARLSWLWVSPIRTASAVAARAVSARARRLARG